MQALCAALPRSADPKQRRRVHRGVLDAETRATNSAADRVTSEAIA